MTALYASIIRLHALHDVQLTRDAGQWANAVFYGILHQVDPGLTEAIHQWDGRKPFTISSLGGLPRARRGQVNLRAGQECWLRVTSLGEEIFQPFVLHFLQGGMRLKIKLGPVSFGVTEVLTTPGSHPWAGFTEEDHLSNAAQPSEQLTLEFASPTGFHTGRKRYEIVPLPKLVFGSLASKWRNFVSPDTDVKTVETIAGNVLISGFDLRSKTLRWKGRVQKGFCGWCSYDLRKLPPDERRLLSTLAGFAFYAGVGGKTTHGMGQTRRLAGQPTISPTSKVNG